MNMRAAGWNIGFGLQRVDGLEPSLFARRIARLHIVNQLNEHQISSLFDDYHASHSEFLEADMTAFHCVQILQDAQFSCTIDCLQLIHERLFTHVFCDDWVGKWRRENISKREPVLHNQSVHYFHHDLIQMTLAYDFMQEQQRLTSYFMMEPEQIVTSVFDFLAGVWHVHPFRDGNTRAVCVFAILYLQELGFTINDAFFASHSHDVRDAFVLACATNDTRRLHEYARQICMV